MTLCSQEARRANCLARWIASAAVFVSAAATAAPVTFAPGEGYGSTNVSTSVTYTSVQLFADISGIQAGDRFSASFFSDQSLTAGITTNVSLDGSSASRNDLLLLGSGGSGYTEGSFFFNFGTGAASGSSLTFDDVRLVLFNGTTAVQTINVPTSPQAVPEPPTLALAADALLSAGLVRRQRA